MQSALVVEHIVPDTDVKQSNLVRVVESGAFHHGTGQKHGFQIGDRGYRSCPSDLIINAQDAGESLFCLEFEKSIV